MMHNQDSNFHQGCATDSRDFTKHLNIRRQSSKHAPFLINGFALIAEHFDFCASKLTARTPFGAEDIAIQIEHSISTRPALLPESDSLQGALFLYPLYTLSRESIKTRVSLRQQYGPRTENTVQQIFTHSSYHSHFSRKSSFDRLV